MRIGPVPESSCRRCLIINARDDRVVCIRCGRDVTDELPSQVVGVLVRRDGTSRGTGAKPSDR